MREQREWNIDYLRIFASFMVILIHVSAQNWRTTDVTSLEWMVFHFYDISVQSAVPIFFMISGKLFLQKDTLAPLPQFFRKNVLKIIGLYFLWSLFYAIDTIGLYKLANGNVWGELLEYTVNSKYHLWYIPALVGIYCLLPILWSLVKYENGKYTLYAVEVWLLFAIVKDTALVLPIDGNLKVLIKEFDYALEGFCGYFLLGYVLDKYKDYFKKIKTSILILSYIFTVSISAYIDWRQTVLASELKVSLYGDFVISTFLEACIIFLLFSRIPDLPLKDWMYRGVKTVSRYTLFVYLSHVFVLEHLEINLGITTLSFHPVFSVPAIAISVFLICMMIAFIVDHIPYVRNLIM